MVEQVLVALVVRDSLVEGCRKVGAVDYMTAEVGGYMMAGDVECRTSEVAGYNLHKQHEYVNNVV